jgi:integrase/recombinase XerD
MRSSEPTGQLSLIDAPLPAVPVSLPHPPVPGRAEGSGGRSARSAAYALTSMGEAFLDHLRRVRRCSEATVRAYRSDYGKTARLLEQLGLPTDVRQITVTGLQACLAGLAHQSAATTSRLIHALSSLYKHLIQQGTVAQSPVSGLAYPQRGASLTQCPSVTEVETLLAACQHPGDRVLIALMACCGLRRAEVLALNVADVAVDLSVVRVRGKGNKERAVPLRADLRQLLRLYLSELPAGASARVQNEAKRRMRPTTLARRFQRIMECAGLSDRGYTPHSLRHFFGTQLVRAGVDVATVSRLMGHSNISVTSIYLHADDQTLAGAVEKLPPVALGGPPAPVQSVAES